MKINFQTACQLVAKEHNYNTWEELLADNEAHTHYYQLAADRYVMVLDDHMNSIEQLTELQLELGYKRGELSTVAMLGLVGEAGEVLDETDYDIHRVLRSEIVKAIHYCRKVDELKKIVRSGEEDLTLGLYDEDGKDFNAELADCLYYINILAFNRNLTLWDLAQMAYDKIKRKQSEGGSSEDPKK